MIIALGILTVLSGVGVGAVRDSVLNPSSFESDCSVAITVDLLCDIETGRTLRARLVNESECSSEIIGMFEPWSPSLALFELKFAGMLIGPIPERRLINSWDRLTLAPRSMIKGDLDMAIFLGVDERRLSSINGIVMW